MMSEGPVREMMQDEIDRLTREVERLTNREAAANGLAADAVAEIERLRVVIEERDAHGRIRTAAGLRERNRADEAEAETAKYKDLYTQAQIALTAERKKSLDAEQEIEDLRMHLADIRSGVRW